MTAVSYSGIITSIRVPDRSGKLDDVVLGYDTLHGYLVDNSHYDATVGRYGNRIGSARFEPSECLGSKSSSARAAAGDVARGAASSALGGVMCSRCAAKVASSDRLNVAVHAVLAQSPLRATAVSAKGRFKFLSADEDSSADALTVCARQPSEAPGATELRALEDELSRALVERDRTTLERLWHDDLVFIARNGQQSTKAERLANLAAEHGS